MIVAVFIVQHAAFLNTLLCHVNINMNFPVRTPVGCHNAKLHCIQRMPRVSSRQIRQKLQRLFADIRVKASHSLLTVINRTLNQRLNVLPFQRL